MSRAFLYYDFDEYDYSDFLTDFQNEKAAWINEPWSSALDNKLLFHQLLEPFNEFRVNLFGLLANGRFIRLDSPVISRHDEPRQEIVRDGGSRYADDASPDDSYFEIYKLLRTEKILVLKPVDSSGGKGVHIISYSDGEVSLDGEPITLSELINSMIDFGTVLVTEFIEQAPYSADIFPDASNTIRIVTAWDDQRGEAFPLNASHRFGTRRSAPVDNISSGGIESKIDIATGELGPVKGAAEEKPPEVRRFSVHPETGAQIEGVRVPNWDEIYTTILSIADNLSFLKYVGWDVLLTGSGGFKILEANNLPSATEQVHGPYLTDERTRRFFEQHGVL